MEILESVEPISIEESETPNRWILAEYRIDDDIFWELTLAVDLMSAEAADLWQHIPEDATYVGYDAPGAPSSILGDKPAETLWLWRLAVEAV